MTRSRKRGPRPDLERDTEVLKELYKPSDPEGEGVKEIKVMIPAEYHKKLHGYKVLTGRTVSLMVCEALDHYFSKRKEEGGGGDRA